MIDERFLIERFDETKVGPDLSSDLHRALETEIAQYLHTEVEKALQQLTMQLRDLGHHIEFKPPVYNQDYASWEYEVSGANRPLKPRLHVDTQVAVLTGYKK